MNVHQLTAVSQLKANFILLITAAATNGAGVDGLGYDKALALFYSLPTGAGTTSDCKLQDSLDNSSFADVASATFAQATTAGGAVLESMEINLANRRRYIRLVHTGAGGSAAGEAAGIIILYRGRWTDMISQAVAPVVVA